MAAPRRSMLLSACVLLTAIGASAQTDLKAWIGHYPNALAYPNPKGLGNLFAVPEVRTQLEDILGKSDRRLLTVDYSVQSPIELVADKYLLAEVCQPHVCANRALMAINLDDNKVLVGFWGGQERWFGAKQADVPAAVRDRLTPAN